MRSLNQGGSLQVMPEQTQLSATYGALSRSFFGPTFIPIGDSFTDYNGGVNIATPAQAGSPLVLEGKGIANWANVFLCHSVTMLGQAGIGGQNSIQIQARFATDVIARKPDMTWILAGINNSETQPIAGNLQQMYEAAFGAGILVVAMTIPPGFKTGGGTTVSAALELHRLKTNSWIREYVRTHRGIVLADIASAWQDPAATGFKPLVNYVSTSDGIHPTVAGAMAGGRVIADALRPLIPNTRTRAVVAGGPYNLLANPHFNGTSGTTPSGWGLSGSAVTTTLVPRSDGYPGNGFRCLVPAGGQTKILTNASVDGVTLSVGDSVEFGIILETTSLETAAVQYVSASQRQYSTTFTGNPEAYDVRWQSGASYGNGIPLPNGEIEFRTPPVTIASGVGLLQSAVDIGGGGTYTLKGAFVRNLTKIAAALAAG